MGSWLLFALGYVHLSLASHLAGCDLLEAMRAHSGFQTGGLAALHPLKDSCRLSFKVEGWGGW